MTALKSKGFTYYILEPDLRALTLINSQRIKKTDAGYYATDNFYKASLFFKYADEVTKRKLQPYITRYQQSYSASTNFVAKQPFRVDELTVAQNVAVELATQENNILIADHMGSGKTAMSICAANSIEAKKILVVCPAIVKANWLREFNNWFTGDLNQIDVVKNGRGIPDTDVVIVNYDLIAMQNVYSALLARAWDLVILDEVHYLKSYKAKRALAALGSGGLTSKTERVIGLSGTPMMNRPIELYPTLASLSPRTIEPYSDYYAYATKFCGGKQGVFGWEDKGASCLPELNFRLRSTFMIRRDPKVFNAENSHTKKFVQIDIKQSKEYLEIEKDLLAEPEYSDILELLKIDMKGDKKKQGDAAKKRARLGVLKIGAVAAFCESIIDAGEKVVVFAHHREVVMGLYNYLHPQIKGVAILGGMTDKAKQEAIDNFINDEDTRFMAANSETIGTGTDGLQKVCNYCVFAETDWSPTKIEQCISRLDRRGQQLPVFAYFPVVSGSYDELIIRSNDYKLKNIEKGLN